MWDRHVFVNLVKFTEQIEMKFLGDKLINKKKASKIDIKINFFY